MNDVAKCIRFRCLAETTWINTKIPKQPATSSITTDKNDEKKKGIEQGNICIFLPSLLDRNSWLMYIQYLGFSSFFFNI